MSRSQVLFKCTKTERRHFHQLAAHRKAGTLTEHLHNLLRQDSTAAISAGWNAKPLPPRRDGRAKI